MMASSLLSSQRRKESHQQPMARRTPRVARGVVPTGVRCGPAGGEQGGLELWAKHVREDVT